MRSGNARNRRIFVRDRVCKARGDAQERAGHPAKGRESGRAENGCQHCGDRVGHRARRAGGPGGSVSGRPVGDRRSGAARCGRCGRLLALGDVHAGDDHRQDRHGRPGPRLVLVLGHHRREGADVRPAAPPVGALRGQFLVGPAARRPVRPDLGQAGQPDRAGFRRRHDRVAALVRRWRPDPRHVAARRPRNAGGDRPRGRDDQPAAAVPGLGRLGLALSSACSARSGASSTASS